MKPMLAAIIALPLLLTMSVADGRAEQLTSDAIVRSLAPKPKAATRSLAPATTSAAPALSAADAAYLHGLPTRGLKIEMKDKLAEIVAHNDLPRIDIEIRFAYNSADIAPDSRADVDALGVALLADSLVDARIALNGHTDAVGSDGYNMELSERRAEAVRDYLVHHHGIDGQRLIAVGFGERRLKNGTHADAAENRRVEVVNLY